MALPQNDLQLLRNMSVGDAVDMQVTTPTAPKRVRTRYLGMEEEQGMFFAVPSSTRWAAIKDLLLPGNSLIIRHVIEGDTGTIIAFKVNVLRLLNNPFSLLVTSFPDALQSQGLRAVRRGYPGIAVTAIGEGFDHTEAVITDISPSGCRIAIRQANAPEATDNKRLTLGYQLGDKPLTIETLVKNVSRESSYVYMGLQFVSGQESVALLLERHILHYE